MGDSFALLALVLMLVGARWARPRRWSARSAGGCLVIQPGPPGRGRRLLIRVVGVLVGLQLLGTMWRMGAPELVMVLGLAFGVACYHAIQWRGWSRLRFDREGD